MSVDFNHVFSSASNVEQLRYLLHTVDENKNQRVKPSIDFLAAKHHYQPPQSPAADDLLRLIQSTEKMNQQLVNENRFLKDEIANCKNNCINLVQENQQLHNELKNVTVHEILNEFESKIINEEDNETEKKLKQKTEELHQSELLINDLQNKLNLAINNTSIFNNNENIDKDDKIINKKTKEQEKLKSNENILCSNCAGINDLITKNEEIDRYKRDIEQLNKTINFLKNKIDEININESDLHLQIKKYSDLVKHLELEKEQNMFEKDQYKSEKEAIKMKMDELIFDCDKRVKEEKKILEDEIDLQKKQYTDQIQNIENIIAKNEALIDRLTREKITLHNELEDFKNKYITVDVNSHQINEKLRGQYQEILKERDILLLENKRIRHDYDIYVKQNDQDKFCLRNELNNTRNRLLSSENELLGSKEQTIKLADENNKLQTEIISLKHSKETLESSRDKNLKVESDKFKKRETLLTATIVKLQNMHCMKTKELQDLIDSQQILLDKLRAECKGLTHHIEKIDLKYSENLNNLNTQIESYKIKCNKYEERAREFEDENIKHTNLHERMKERLQELTHKTQDQHEELQKVSTNEHKLKLKTQQLIQDLATARQQLAIYSIPTKMKIISKGNEYNDIEKNTIKNDNTLNMILNKIQN